MDDATRIMQEKAAHVTALANREAMAAAFKVAGGTLAGAVKAKKPSVSTSTSDSDFACGGRYL